VIEVIQATDAHALGLNIRPEDRKEIIAGSGLEPTYALRRSVQVSTTAWTATVNGEPAAIFGVGPLNILNGMGSPWLISSPEITDNTFEFLRKSRDYVEEMHQTYPVLFNLVHSENQISIRWLRWLGFLIHEPIKYGKFGTMFRPFEKVKRHV
jgi:hypothetical protein